MRGGAFLLGRLRLCCGISVNMGLSGDVGLSENNGSLLQIQNMLWVKDVPFDSL